MSRLSAIVVDDEPLAREALRGLLARDPEVRLVGEAADGRAALDLIRSRKPDIAFLDVEMPAAGGLEVAAALAADELPAIVFVTAYGSYAAGAFDVAALDYVVKPFTDARFFEALERAKRRVRERRMSGLAEQMAAVAGELRHGADDEKYLARIPVRGRGRTRLVKTRDLVWLESQDYMVRLHTVDGSHLVRASLASFAERLDPQRFLRVHRQAIVNLDEVVEISGQALRLSNGDSCRVSRSRLAALQAALPSLPA